MSYAAEVGGDLREVSRDFVPNSLFGFGRPQLLNGLRLSKVIAFPTNETS